MRKSPPFAGLLFAASLAPGPARADEVAACVKASESAQTLRDEGKYNLAREQLLVCTRDLCPGIVRRDCTQWLSEIDASMPSVVVSAKDGSGRDLVDVRVTVDGQPFAEKLDGKPLMVDPGKHTFRYEAAGAPPSEEDVVVHAGEKNRALNVRLGGPPQTPPGTPAPAPPAPETSPTPSGAAGPPVAAYVLGGLGVVALGSFAFFGITGKSDVSDLRSSCSPNCQQRDVDHARTKLIIADISLGVGVVALGVATWMILANRSSPPASVTVGRNAARATLDVAPVLGGASAGLQGSF
jgi:hypothetical protein